MVALTRKWGECGSDEKLLCLAFLPSLSRFDVYWIHTYKQTSQKYILIQGRHFLIIKGCTGKYARKKMQVIIVNYDFDKTAVARATWVNPYLTRSFILLIHISVWELFMNVKHLCVLNVRPRNSNFIIVCLNKCVLYMWNRKINVAAVIFFLRITAWF